MNGKQYSWQGIAKLPFIDEERLFAEIAKIEHTLMEEEVWRNSTMCDMLFVAASHRLSEQIFSLDNRCKQLTERQQIEVKEEVKLDLRSACSDGMNGYISPCDGDTHPPIFRSPIKNMEDILANEVICCIYRLLKADKYITCPPAGVTFPPKMVQFSDLKLEPVLWHEDSGRRPGKRPWENGRLLAAGHQMERHNPPGSVSGCKLGEASHRLIANSLHLKVDHNGFSNNMQAPPPSYATAPYIPPVNSYVNYGFHNHRRPRMVSPRQDNSSAGFPLCQHSHLRPPNSHGYYHYQISNQAAANNLHYHPRHHQDGYDGDQRYQAPGNGSYQRGVV